MIRISQFGIFATVYLMLFFTFIYLPIALIVFYSFNANPVNMMNWSGFSAEWYLKVFGFKTTVSETALYVESTSLLVRATLNSLGIATVTTIVATVMGTAVAIGVYRHDFFGRRFYNILLVMPLLLPDIVLGVALLVFFVSAGMQLGLVTIIIGQCTFLISYVFIIVSARLSGMDRKLEYASADLGANDQTTLLKILLPQLFPAILGAGLLAFIISMDDLVITYFVAGSEITTLPMFIFSMLRRGIKPEINVIAVLLLMFSFLVASLGLYLRSRRS